MSTAVIPGRAREPGTQANGLGKYRQGAVFIGSGPAKGHPGMTSSQVIRFLHTFESRGPERVLGPGGPDPWAGMVREKLP
jgi:hypothetical protein